MILDMKLILKNVKNMGPLLICLSFIIEVLPKPSYAQNLQIQRVNKAPQIKTLGDEFFSGEYPGAVMMRIKLWGGVRKPGIHHVPMETDLTTLLSFAGGPTDKAKIDEIKLKRKVGEQFRLMEVNMEDAFETDENLLVKLKPDDIVYVPEQQALFSENTMQMTAFITSMLGIIVSFLLIKDNT